MTPETPYELAAAIRPAMTKLYVLYFRLAEQSDLTGPQLTILTYLDEQGSARISEIASSEGIRMPTASNALHQLEQRGMVERVRDEADRRGVRVRLTSFGKQELDRVGEERTQYLAEMLEHLPKEQYEHISVLPELINGLARNYSPEEREQQAKEVKEQP